MAVLPEGFIYLDGRIYGREEQIDRPDCRTDAHFRDRLGEAAVNHGTLLLPRHGCSLPSLLGKMLAWTC